MPLLDPRFLTATPNRASTFTPPVTSGITLPSAGGIPLAASIPATSTPLGSINPPLFSTAGTGQVTLFTPSFGGAAINQPGLPGFPPIGPLPPLLPPSGATLPPIVSTIVDTVGAVVGTGPCPAGTTKEVGVGPGGGLFTKCVPIAVPSPGPAGAVQRMVPGGASGFISGGFTPATSSRRTCGRGAVLAVDGLCYPKNMLPASMRLNRRRRAVVSWSDGRAIRKAASAKKKLIKLTKDAGAFASNTKPRSGARRAPRAHHHHPAGGVV